MVMNNRAFSFPVRSCRDLLLLLLWGLSILWLAYHGTLALYLHPSLQPYTLGAGFCLLVLAGFAARDIINKGIKREGFHQSGHDHSCCSSKEDHVHANADVHAHDHHLEREGHGHSHGETSGIASLTFKTLLLLLPLVMIHAGNGTKFSISTVQNRGVVQDLANLPAAKPGNNASVAPVSTAPIATSASSSSSPSGSPQPMPIQVIDLLYAVQMPSYREEFEGKEVEMTGQFVPLTTGNPNGDRFQAIRLFITCCAADAKPVGVTVRYHGSLNVPEMGWIKITGIPTFPIEGGRRAAVLEARKVEECAAPDEPFVY